MAFTMGEISYNFLGSDDFSPNFLTLSRLLTIKTLKPTSFLYLNRY